MRRFLAIMFVGLSLYGCSQQVHTVEERKVYPLCENVLFGKDSLVDLVMKDTAYRLSIVFTEVEKDSLGNVNSLREHSFGGSRYAYPASMVKLPIAILTLEKLERLGLSLDDYLKVNAEYTCKNTRFIKRLKERNVSFRELLEELIVVSDNDYYNALYHFLTPKEINNRLSKLKYTQTHIYKSFEACELNEPLRCNSIMVLDAKTNFVKYEQPTSALPSAERDEHYRYTNRRLLGTKHEEKRVIVDGPFDFNFNLELPIRDAHMMMKRLVYPTYFSNDVRWNISEAHREFLLNSLSQFPTTRNVDVNAYKCIMFGEDMTFMNKVKSYSKIGISYGFTNEVAYVLDEANDRAFFLSISIYTNANDIVNDGDYEYQSVARPVIDRISRLFYNYLLNKS